MALVPHNQNLQVYVDTVTGEAYMTMASYALLSGVSEGELELRNTTGIISATLDGAEVSLIPSDTTTDWLASDNPKVFKDITRIPAQSYLQAKANQCAVKPRATKSETCYLYIFEDAQNMVIKVGITNDISKRHSNLECSSGRDLTLRYKRKFNSRKSAYSLEQLIHNRLKFNRMNGEWFDIAYDELPDTVKKLLG